MRFILLLFTVFVAFSGRSEVVYIDLNPDHFENRPLSRYLIDADGNGKADLAVWLFVPVSPETFRVSTFNGNSILGKVHSGLVAPEFLASGDRIGAENDHWAASDGQAAQIAPPGESARSSVDGFLGVRLKKGERTHYGWVAVNLDGDRDGYTISGMAFETDPGKTIIAGDRGPVRPPVGEAGRIYLADAGDENGAQDLYVHFLPAQDELNIEEYRIVVVKAGKAQEKLPTSVPANQYLTMVPQGIDQGRALPPGMRDMDGDLIANGMSYQAQVWAVPGNNGYRPTLSVPSDPIFLSEPPPIAVTEMRATEGDEKENPTFTGLPELPAPQPDRTQSLFDRDYPRVKNKDFKLFSSGKKVILRTEIDDWSPESVIAIYAPNGQTLVASVPIRERETVINLNDSPEGLYNIKANLNGNFVSRPIFIR